jgi:hypothetical protein
MPIVEDSATIYYDREKKKLKREEKNESENRDEKKK